VELAKRQPLSALAASLVALVLTFVLLPGDALARHVQCGERITENVRLDSDLRDCEGVGLVVGADGVTVDLGGHTIDGTGRGTGIVNGYGGDGRRDVEIRNGTVRGFKVGLRSGGRATQLRRLTITKNATGGVVLRGSQCIVERNVISDNGYGHGISLKSAGSCRIDSNRISRQLGAGIETDRSSGNRIEDNRITGNRRAGILLAATTGSAVERNSVLGNDVGISLFDRSNSNIVRRNTAALNATGVAVTFGGTGNRIEHNSVSASDGAGIRFAETGSNNQATRNLVTLSGAEGIRVIDSAALRVEGNSLYDNSGDGIFVAEQDTGGTTLRRNTTNHNGDDGIDADSTMLTIERNVAERNADFGIEATPGVNDGGGNTSRFNGNAAQCAGVACPSR
jgi:parallel beta-helix repeat protein